MPKLNRKAAVVAVGLALLALTGLLLWAVLGTNRVPPGLPDTRPGSPTIALRTLTMGEAPDDVREAATRLMYSRVGYAMARAGTTYLIISTGSDSLKVRLVGASGHPAASTPEFVDVNLHTDGAGQRLLILAAPMTGLTEVQFTLDGVAAGIPTLHNPNNLPLTTLPDDQQFVVLTPTPDVVVSGTSIAVEGYARVFEAQFTVRAVTAKGRVLGERHVMAAAGGPSWGSFVARLDLDGTDLPETGFVIFDDGQSERRVVVPIRFRSAGQLG